MKIAFLGEQLVTAEDVIAIPFDSGSTLLDGDVLVVVPSIERYIRYQTDSYQGKTCLDDNTSFKLRSSVEHWKAELRLALVEGKTVIVFLRSMPIVSVATGEKRVSGTGRNQKVTRIVTDFDPYSFLPDGVGKFVRREGERIKKVDSLGPLASYWREFGEEAGFEVYIDSFAGTTLLKTQTGDLTVGGVIRYKNMPGTLVLLPPPDLDDLCEKRASSLLAKRHVATKPGQRGDTAAAARRAKEIKSKAESMVCSAFVSALIQIDKAVKSSLERTPPPDWIDREHFIVPGEKELREEIAAEDARIVSLLQVQEERRTELHRTLRLKDLLFEKGKPLERAILSALRILGCSAENLEQADSEFDAVIVSPEGERYIGEAEGRDDKAVGVDKLDQLDRNIREDFSRQDETTAKYATGILFANSFRLRPLDERDDFFTAKCCIAAERSQIALVRTPDLFEVAQYLLGTDDAEFARECRLALATAQGKLVAFPSVPVKE